MHLLPCPDCQTPIRVTPSQAGEQVSCPACQGSVPIPNLGQLRQLPLADPVADRSPVARSGDVGPSPARVGFVLLGVLATVSLLIAGFSTIQWVLKDAPLSTDLHIASLESQYPSLQPAELIREYEQMEKYSLDLTVPFKYKEDLVTKQRWGRNALVAACVACLSILGAMLLSRGKHENRDPQGTLGPN